MRGAGGEFVTEIAAPDLVEINSPQISGGKVAAFGGGKLKIIKTENLTDENSAAEN